MEFAVCDQLKGRRADVSFQLAFSRLEIFANRLWQPSEPDVVDVVYGRIWLHSLELAHRLNSTTVADALAGIDFYDANTKIDAENTESMKTKWTFDVINCTETAQGKRFRSTANSILFTDSFDATKHYCEEINHKKSKNSLPSSSLLTESSDDDSTQSSFEMNPERFFGGHAEADDIGRCRLLAVGERQQNAEKRYAGEFSLNEKVTAGGDASNSMKRQQRDGEDKPASQIDAECSVLHYAEPGCLNKADIVALLRVPFDLSCSDPDLFRLVHAVHSDQVRLLWMTPAPCPLGLRASASQPPTLFYRTPFISERYRSRAGPMRRPLLLSWKLRHIQAAPTSRRHHRRDCIATVAGKFLKTSVAKVLKAEGRYLDRTKLASGVSKRHFYSVVNGQSHEPVFYAPPQTILSDSLNNQRKVSVASSSKSCKKKVTWATGTTNCESRRGIIPTILLGRDTVADEWKCKYDGDKFARGSESARITSLPHQTQGLVEDYNRTGSSDNNNVVMETLPCAQRRSMPDSDVCNLGIRTAKPATTGAAQIDQDSLEHQVLSEVVPFKQSRHSARRKDQRTIKSERVSCPEIVSEIDCIASTAANATDQWSSPERSGAIPIDKSSTTGTDKGMQSINSAVAPVLPPEFSAQCAINEFSRKPPNNLQSTASPWQVYQNCNSVSSSNEPLLAVQTATSWSTAIFTAPDNQPHQQFQGPSGLSSAIAVQFRQPASDSSNPGFRPRCNLEPGYHAPHFHNHQLQRVPVIQMNLCPAVMPIAVNASSAETFISAHGTTHNVHGGSVPHRQGGFFVNLQSKPKPVATDGNPLGSPQWHCLSVSCPEKMTPVHGSVVVSRTAWPVELRPGTAMAVMTAGGEASMPPGHGQGLQGTICNCNASNRGNICGGDDLIVLSNQQLQPVTSLGGQFVFSGNLQQCVQRQPSHRFNNGISLVGGSAFRADHPRSVVMSHRLPAAIHVTANKPTMSGGGTGHITWNSACLTANSHRSEFAVVNLSAGTPILF